MKRDEVAFAAIVDAYQARLLQYVTRLLSHSSPAEDIVQRVFIKCATSWKGALEPSDDLSAWLYRIAHNEAIDYVRREKRLGFLHLRHREEREAEETHVTLPAKGMGAGEEPTEEALEAVEALQRLGERDRQLVTLRVYEEKSYREIAEITGLSVNNVGVTLHNALKKLAIFLKKGGKDTP